MPVLLQEISFITDIKQLNVIRNTFPLMKFIIPYLCQVLRYSKGNFYVKMFIFLSTIRKCEKVNF